MRRHCYWNRLLSMMFTMLLPLSVLQAAPVDKEQALEKARQFYNNRGQVSKTRKLKQVSRAVDVSTAMTNDCFYVFNVGEHDGFVIISGDDRTPSVLGYADEGNFSADNMPDNLKAWLEGYAAQLHFLQQSSNDAQYSMAPITSHATVSTLMTSMWDQNDPYNSLCPVFFDESKYGRAVTGCVATAMAQIMYYHKHPTKTTQKIPSYTCYTNRSEYLGTSSASYISVPEVPVTTFNWSNMVDRYYGNESTTQKNAVAKLMQACGASVKMEYGITDVGGSSAYSQKIKGALTNYFDYDKSMQFVQRKDYSASDWDNLIYAEIAGRRPVCYSGQATGGGHQFVVDGYDGAGYYHVNWGWSGYLNGFFLLSILTPSDDSGIGASSGGYNAYQTAVIGIKPNQGGDNPSNEVMTTDSINITGSRTFTRSSTSSNFTNVSFGMSVWNRNGHEGTFDTGYAIYDSSGKQLSTTTLFSNINYLDTYGYWCYKTVRTFNLGANLGNGKYRIVPVSRKTGSTQWLPNSGSNIYYILATINGNTMKLSYPSENMTASLTLKNSPEAYGPADLEITITNNGADYNGNIHLYAMAKDSSYVYEDQLDIKGGESLTRKVSVKFNEKGSYDMSLFVDDFKTLAKIKVQVTDAKEQSMTCTYDVKNANSSTRVINDNSMNLDITFTNSGSNKYDNDVKIYLGKKKADNSGYEFVSCMTDRLTLNVGASVKRNYVFNHLENGGIYYVTMYYFSKGEQKYYKASYAYTVNYDGSVEKSAYAVVNNGTLTFYYDTKKDSRQGKIYSLNSDVEYPAWAVDSMSIHQAYIDASFANYSPVSTAHWFRHQANLTNIQGMENLNTSGTTIMQSMFYECYKLTSVDVSGFKTDNVTNMGWMFYDCNSLKSLNVKNFNTSNVTNMQSMFYNCSSLTSINVSGFTTDNVTNMGWMFFGCNSLTSLNLKNFNTSKVVNMQSMFYNCFALTDVDVSGFKTDKVTSMGWMFFGCKSLKSVDVSKFNTSKVTIMNNMFTECEKFTSLDLRNFNTANVTDMNRMFYGCTALAQLNVSSFNTSKVTDMEAMFYNCENLTAVDLSGFQTPKLTNMSFMFRGCSKLTMLDMSGFTTGSVKYVNVLFYDCQSLKTIYASEDWDTSKVENSAWMFGNCNSLVGGAGTTFDASHIQHEYARIDGGTSKPGYFTYKAAQRKGDVNSDGSVNVADIAGIIDVMAKGGSNAFADVNDDSVVNVADIGAVIDIMAANARKQSTME